MKLKQDQKTAIKFLLAGRRKLLADDMGLGKTACAVVAIGKVNKGRRVIICPPQVVTSWENELKVWSRGKRKVQTVASMVTFFDPLADTLLVPFSLLHSPMIADQLLNESWGVVVVDECHLAKNPKANRTQVIFGKGRKVGLIDMTHYFWALSGTPMTKSPIDLWPLLRRCASRQLAPVKDWMGYTKKYCNRFMDSYTGQWNVSGAANVEELKTRIFDGKFGLRRLKAEERSYKKTYRITTSTTKTGTPTLWTKGIKTSVLAGKWTSEEGDIIAELRVQAVEDKLPIITKKVKAIVDGGEKVVVFCWHRDSVELISNALEFEGVELSLFHGGISKAEKEKQKESFCLGSSMVLVANICSAGTGLNGLQHVCHNAIFAETPWNYADLAQASDRLDRMGQSKEVLIDIIVQKDSIDAMLLGILLKKHKSFKELLTSSAES